MQKLKVKIMSPYIMMWNSPIPVGHNNFMEAMLIFIVKINVGPINSQPTLNL